MKENEMTTLALFGAAGKIGTRIANRLKDGDAFDVLYVEAGLAGETRLRQWGAQPTPQAEALRRADVFVLAVPDRVLGALAQELIPQIKPAAMVIFLDPAVPVSGLLPEREDVSYFVVHPCHPPVVNDEITPQAKADFYGGIAARQSLVCALMQGPEQAYALGERIVREMFAPILRVHRITVEQMALLEPAMAETVVLTCMFIMKEAMEQAVARGVPAEAAFDFLMGHINVNLGIMFGFLPNTQFSDGAYKMVENAKKQLIRPDWQQVFEPENLAAQVGAIVHG
jgi:hypothetical protein